MKFSYDYALQLVNATIFSASSMELVLDDNSTKTISVDNYSTQKVVVNNSSYLQATVISSDTEFNNNVIKEVRLYDDNNTLIVSAKSSYETEKGSFKIYFDIYIELEESNDSTKQS